MFQQRAQIVRGAPLGRGLQSPSGGQHERDQCPGQVLPHRQGPAECQDRDEIHASVSPLQRGQYPDDGGHDSDHGAQTPAQVGDVGRTGEPGDATGGQGAGGGRQQQWFEASAGEQGGGAAEQFPRDAPVHGVPSNLAAGAC